MQTILSERFYIESFGVKFEITVSNSEGTENIKKHLTQTLGGRFEFIENSEADFKLKVNWNKNKYDSIHFEAPNNKQVEREKYKKIKRNDTLQILDSKIRLTIAEFAVKKVFIHAGVVGWKGRAIVVPARSNRGKTSLVVELIKRGAEYYSDEYAVLDENGMVEPFPKYLSVRGIIDEYRQLDIAPEKFEAKIGEKKIPVGMFLLTEYKENARWKPKHLSSGMGIMEIINHCPPIRKNPQFTLNVLNKAIKRAIIVKSFRGDVFKSAEMIINYFETKVLENPIN